MNRILFFLEPLWFRDAPQLLKSHLDDLVKNLVTAVCSEDDNATVGVASNIFVCLQALDVFRAVTPNTPRADLFAITSSDALQDMDLLTSAYAADLLAPPETPFANMRLHDKIQNILQEFDPSLVVATTPNRYLSALCAQSDIPLISLAHSPLPQGLYRNERYMSFSGSLSDGPFRSVQAFQDSLRVHRVSKVETNRLKDFRTRFTNLAQQHPRFEECRTFLDDNKTPSQSVAMLVLEPTHWLPWIGALGQEASPETVILRALRNMHSDKLVVVIPAGGADALPPQTLNELWLSHPSIIKLPNALNRGMQDTLLPMVDEVIGVSAESAMTAFLLGKRLTALGQSFMSTLAELSADTEHSDTHRALAFTLLRNRLLVAPTAFEAPDVLWPRIAAKLAKTGDTKTVAKKESSVIQRISPQDTLETIHAQIQTLRAQPNPPSLADLFQAFGRHALGYAALEGSIGIELGVAAGVFSESLLRSGQFARLYSVDRWSDHHDDAEYAFVRDRLAPFKEASVILRHSFEDAFAMLPDAHLDFLYIDAYAHTGVAGDILKAWLPKMKPGGLVAGHDFCHACWPENHRKLSDAFDMLGLRNITTVSGVVSFNTEDIFPSFLAKVDLDRCETRRISE